MLGSQYQLVVLLKAESEINLRVPITRVASFELLACKETALPWVVTPSYFTACTVRFAPSLSFSIVKSLPSESLRSTLKSEVELAVTPVAALIAFIAVTAADTLVLLIAKVDVAVSFILIE